MGEDSRPDGGKTELAPFAVILPSENSLNLILCFKTVLLKALTKASLTSSWRKVYKEYRRSSSMSKGVMADPVGVAARAPLDGELLAELPPVRLEKNPDIS